MPGMREVQKSWEKDYYKRIGKSRTQMQTSGRPHK